MKPPRKNEIQPHLLERCSAYAHHSSHLGTARVVCSLKLTTRAVSVRISVAIFDRGGLPSPGDRGSSFRVFEKKINAAVGSTVFANGIKRQAIRCACGKRKCNKSLPSLSCSTRVVWNIKNDLPRRFFLSFSNQSINQSTCLLNVAARPAPARTAVLPVHAAYVNNLPR